MKFLSILCVFLAAIETDAQIVPASYLFPATDTVSVNGSSATGHCSNVTTGIGDGSLSTCDAPTTSVLFDGNIPTLTGLDGDMWASQLLTVQESTMVELIFDFRGREDSGVELVEVIMFNCPELGISAGVIRLLAAAFLTGPHAGLGTFSSSNITSCNSLVRLCIPQSITLPVITLQFFLPPGSNWVHLAEVIFYRDVSVTTCTSGPVTAPPPVTTTLTAGETVETVDSTMSPTVQNLPTISNQGLPTQGPTFPTQGSPTFSTQGPPTFSTQGSDATRGQVVTCSSCSPFIALASVITAIATALLTTVIFVLVQVAVCKCRPKLTPAGGEGQENEQVDGGVAEADGKDPDYVDVNQEYEDVGGYEVAMALTDSTYLEVVRGSTFRLKTNEAYGTTHLH